MLNQHKKGNSICEHTKRGKNGTKRLEEAGTKRLEEAGKDYVEEYKNG